MNEDGEGMYFTHLSSSGTDATFGTVKGKGKKKDESIEWSEAK